MNNIRSYQDLLVERQRLKLLLLEREMELKTEYETIKTRLKPLGNILDFADKITTKDRNNPLIDTGIDIGVNLLLKNLLFRNAGWIVKLLMPLFVRNYLSHEVKENPGWLQKVTRFVKKQFG